ncbi:MAG: hypothetical protein ACOCVH_00730 [Verrucomicrobiota bacterium]
MQDDSLPKKEDPKIPPKLDLNKDGILKPETDKQDAASAQQGEAGQKADTESKQEKKPETPKQEEGQADEQKKPSAEIQNKAQATGSTGAAPGDSPTIKIKPPGLRAKPGTPVQLRDNAQEAQEGAAAQEESKKTQVGIPSGRGGEAAKKETSKIPLDQAKTASGGQSGQASRPKTIKISPAGNKTAAQKPPVQERKETSGSEGSSQDEKRKTSRISLESALGMDKTSGGLSGSPKTIRLKRPSASGGKVNTGPTIKKPGGASQEDEISRTAEIKDEPAGEDGTPTRRKTIKVKRAGQRKTVRKTPQPVQRGAAETQGAPAQGQVVAPAGQKEPGVFFALTGIAALLVTLVTIYVMTAQAFGPNNVSLSRISYGLPGLDLTWPGEIQ